MENPTVNDNIQPEPKKLVSLNKKTLILTGLIVLLVLAVITLFYKLKTTKTTMNTDATSHNSNTVKSCQITDPYVYQSKFSVGNESVDVSALLLDNGSVDERFKPLLQKIDLSVMKIIRVAYSEQTKYVALLLGVYDHNGKNEFKVYITDTSKNAEFTTVLEKSYPTATTHESVSDISFSPNGKLLGIATTNEFYTYDIDSAESAPAQLQFSNTEPLKGDRFVYRRPIFSADNSKVLILKGYYEGGEFIVYDLNKKQFVPFPNKSFTTYESTVGWYNNQVVISRYSNSEINKQTGYYLVTPGGDEKYVISFPKNTNSFKGAVSGDNLFYTIESSPLSGKYSCNNDNSRFQVISSIDKLFVYNLKTGTTKELFTFDYTSASGVDTSKIHHLITMIPFEYKGTDSVILQLNIGASQIMSNYVVDLNTNSLIPVNSTASYN